MTKYFWAFSEIKRNVDFINNLDNCRNADICRVSAVKCDEDERISFLIDNYTSHMYELFNRPIAANILSRHSVQSQMIYFIYRYAPVHWPRRSFPTDFIMQSYPRLLAASLRITVPRNVRPTAKPFREAPRLRAKTLKSRMRGKLLLKRCLNDRLSNLPLDHKCECNSSNATLKVWNNLETEHMKLI